MAGPPAGSRGGRPKGAHSWPRTGATGALLGAFLLLTPSVLLAEAHFSLREGATCASCHMNKTGGGMRSPGGVMYALEWLPRHPANEAEDDAIFRGSVTRVLSIGSDFRASHESTFTSSGDVNGFDVREGNVYANLTLAQGRLQLYLDEHVAPGAARSREAFVLFDDLPGNVFVKTGRFFPAYGWRLQDDEAFIRSSTGYTFDAPDDGIEIGWEPGRISSSLSVTNGSGGSEEQDEDKLISILSTYSESGLTFGVSASANRQEAASRHLGGLLGGLRAGPLVLLGEIDFARVESRTGFPPPGSIRETVRQVIGYGEVNWLVRTGINLKATYDYLDGDRSQSGDEVDRIGVGCELSPVPYLRLRVFLRRTDRPPEVRGLSFVDEREIMAEVHVFL